MSMGPLGIVIGAGASPHSQERSTKTVRPDQEKDTNNKSQQENSDPEPTHELNSKDLTGQSGGQLDLTA